MGKRIALLGAGEVGKAIKKIAEEKGFRVLVRDLECDEFDGGSVEALHVCISQKDEKFINVVSEAVLASNPKIVIIHTSTAPGTTEKVFEKINIPTAHSPIRGDHPDLYHSVKNNFVKYVGGVDAASARLAMTHLKKIGIKKVRNGGSALNTELGKMVNILGFTWSIIFCKWVKKICDDMGADFDMVYKDFTETYNKGYGKSRSDVRQSILKPIKGPIGGHCIIPDTILVDKVYKSDLTKFILKKDEEYKKEK